MQPVFALGFSPHIYIQVKISFSWFLPYTNSNHTKHALEVMEYGLNFNVFHIGASGWLFRNESRYLSFDHL